MEDKEVRLHSLLHGGCYSLLLRKREDILDEVQRDGTMLQYVDRVHPDIADIVTTNFNKERDIVLAAVKQNGLALEFADESLQKDREIVLAAVQVKGCGLEFADESFKIDNEIVLEAVKQDGNAFKFADESLRKDREIVLEATKLNEAALQFAHDSLQKDRLFVLEAIKLSYTYAFKYIQDGRFRKDREIALAAVTQDGNALLFFHKLFRKDREIVTAALKQNREVISHIDESLKEEMANL